MSVQPDGTVKFARRAELRRLVAAYRQASWADTCVAYRTGPADVARSWSYVKDHPIFHRLVLPAKLIATPDLVAALSDERLAKAEAKAFVVDGYPDLSFDFVKVNPATEAVDDDDTANTALRVWVEAGPWLWLSDFPRTSRWQCPPQGQPCHDYRLDVGAATFEKAVVALARRISCHYGDDRSKVRFG